MSMDVMEAWKAIKDRFDTSLGYEGDELDEMASLIMEMEEAVQVVDDFIYNNAE